ncbi:MAG: hypothetical protein E5W56_11365 [Mesorhizobium sp.]|nr:MAG: hypothetical protein E5W56_11365 [Mesorhizobium sp.]
MTIPFFIATLFAFESRTFRQVAIVCRRRKSPGPGRTRNGRLSIRMFGADTGVKVDNCSLE